MKQSKEEIWEQLEDLRSCVIDILEYPSYCFAGAQLIVDTWNAELRAELQEGHRKRGTKSGIGIPIIELSWVSDESMLKIPITKLRWRLKDGRKWGTSERLHWPLSYVPVDFDEQFYRAYAMQETFSKARKWETQILTEYAQRTVHMQQYLDNLRRLKCTIHEIAYARHMAPDSVARERNPISDAR